MYHVKEIPTAPPGGLDMNIADEEEFSPDKLRANIERLYMTIVSLEPNMPAVLGLTVLRVLVLWDLASRLFVFAHGEKLVVQPGSALHTLQHGSWT
jgi:hypothetical protein